MDTSKRRRLTAQLANERYQLFDRLLSELELEVGLAELEMAHISIYLNRKKNEAYELGKA